MPRYIDADEFVKRVIQYPRQSTKTIGLALADTPTADVVEVVRCKDCKWFNDFGCAIRIVDDSDKPKDNDFCSFGERKETKDEHEYKHWCGNCQIRIYIQRHEGRTLTWHDCPYTCEYATAMRWKYCPNCGADMRGGTDG